MKNLFKILIVFICLTTYLQAQTINQFDAQGQRNGVWQKNFKGTDVLRYEGTFSHGKEVGVFKFYKNINGKPVLTATREFNPKNNMAQVTFYASNGQVISEGQMLDKTYIGEWKYYHKNSKQLMMLEQYNKKGNLEGTRSVFYPNGQVAEKSFYKNAALEGEALWYAENGVLIKVYHYKDNKLHGAAKFYDKNGELIQEGAYQNDRKHGIWKYYENGTLKEEKDFTRRSKNPKKN